MTIAQKLVVTSAKNVEHKVHKKEIGLVNGSSVIHVMVGTTCKYKL